MTGGHPGWDVSVWVLICLCVYWCIGICVYEECVRAECVGGLCLCVSGCAFVASRCVPCEYGNVSVGMPLCPWVCECATW